MATLLVLSGIYMMALETPTKKQRHQITGQTEELPSIMKKALDPGRDFEPMPRPGPHDWLAAHRETGQSFEQFVQSRPNKPDGKRKIIYLLPLGDFPVDGAPPVELLREYASTYFAMEVRVLPRLSLGSAEITARRNPATDNRQILTTDVLTVLKKQIPDDAFCLLGITMEDLYPEPSWNFVFGQASLRERVGVYSFARYDPAFYGRLRGDDHRKILLRRSCKVLAHETGHMFGLQHCIYYCCVFNGSNHLAESDARPMHECPVDVRKLQHSIGFDVIERYTALYRFYTKVGFDDEADWTRSRLEHILGKKETNKLIGARNEGGKP